MKTMKLFIITILCATVKNLYAQVPADSLLGVYAGEFWEANPYTAPWVKSPDTLYVQNIDSINCLLQYISRNISTQSSSYQSDYFSCNAPTPSNVRFYGLDSLSVIVAYYPQPYPHHPISYRFYGKRISPIILGKNKIVVGTQLKIYPNLCNNSLNIDKEFGEDAILIISDMLGREVKREILHDRGRLIINTSDINEGAYILRINLEGSCLSKKLIIQH